MFRILLNIAVFKAEMFWPDSWLEVNVTRETNESFVHAKIIIIIVLMFEFCMHAIKTISCNVWVFFILASKNCGDFTES